jgi:HSP20 family molecular chaperone IbpA
LVELPGVAKETVNLKVADGRLELSAGRDRRSAGLFRQFG